jgi:hypothetical protein
MIDWPEKLIESIARRRSVLFLGSGISANSQNATGKRPATWDVFLRRVIANQRIKIGSYEAEILKLLDEKKYLIACEQIVDIIGQTEFGEEAQEEFRRPKYFPAEIHKIIYSLDSKLVITPNVDKIYDECAITESHSSVVVKKYYDSDLAKYLRTNDYLVIKAHGTVDETSKMIFTHKQYSNARCNYASFYKLLDSLILTHTFVFLGCGIDDPDIQLTLENANFLYEGCPPHYFVTANGTITDSMKKILLVNRNLEVITYENVSGNHSELLEGLKDLGRLVDERRVEISATSTW